jgi:hypothetical protein
MPSRATRSGSNSPLDAGAAAWWDAEHRAAFEER